MRISFDLDDTLICSTPAVPREHPPWPLRPLSWGAEPLRRGTRALFAALRRDGHSVWIYTTSWRSTWRIRVWLALHAIRVGGIVNAQRHERALRGSRFVPVPSKYPPAFGIDLHVDDSEGVAVEAGRHGYRAVIVRPDDADWWRRVLAAVGAPGRLLESPQPRL